MISFVIDNFDDGRCFMSQIQAKSFETSKKFFDDANFPRGFQRSGDFTRQQADILENMGDALKSLHEGTREAATDARHLLWASDHGHRPRWPSREE